MKDRLRPSGRQTDKDQHTCNWGPEKKREWRRDSIYLVKSITNQMPCSSNPRNKPNPNQKN